MPHLVTTTAWLVASSIAFIIFNYNFLSIDTVHAIGSGLFSDDAYFYITLANNFLKSGSVYFYQDMPTNGYQPLWFWILVFWGKIVGTLKVSHLLILVKAIICLSFAMSQAVFSKMFGEGRRVWLAVFNLVTFWNPLFVLSLANGLETALLMILFLTFVYALQRFQWVETYKKSWLIVLLANLLFLTRLDMFWLPLIVNLWVLKSLVRDFDRNKIHALLPNLLSVAYVTSNFIYYDHAVPISGRVKRFLMDYHFDVSGINYWSTNEWYGIASYFGDIFALKITHVSAALYVLLTVIVLLVSLSRSFGLSKMEKMISICLCLHIFLMQLVYKELRPYTSYYFCLTAMWVIFLLLKGISIRLHSTKILVITVLFLIVFVPLMWKQRKIKDSEIWVTRQNIMQEFSNQCPDCTIGAYWPGLFSYLHPDKVIPLDGIIGSEDFFEKYVKTQTELDFLNQNKIDYIVIAGNPDFLKSTQPPEISNWSVLYRKSIWSQRDRWKIHSQNKRWCVLKRVENEI